MRKNILGNASGNIAIAMLLVITGAMSGITMAGLAFRDTMATMSEMEDIQCVHFLRTEADRGAAYLEIAAKKDPDIIGGIRTPERRIGMSGSDFKKTYIMQSLVNKEKEESDVAVAEVGGHLEASGTGASISYYQVRSLVEGKTGTSDVYYGRKNLSLTRKYGELTLVQDTGPVFMYFTDSELSPNDENVYFYGYDVINGPVHSNTDIRIKQAGGGNNDNWPTFLALVTTSGEVISTPETYPEDTVFQGGLIEHYEGYEFPENMNEIKSYGTRIGSGFSDDRIVMIEINDYNVNGWVGEISHRRAQVPLYPNYPMGYPYPPGSETAINRFPTTDTLWVPLSSVNAHNNRAYWVDSKLWIKGTIRGFQTWASTDTMWLIGDLLYNSTPRGASPETNNRDMLGLVSEKSIIVKYAYMNPEDSVRVHCNMGADAATPVGGIWIYAAMAALGKGKDNRYEDGVFTYEYQHPHGSIPAVKFNPSTDNPDVGPIVFDMIDLHRHYWPQSSAHLWPPELDFPWYNPIWPEANPYCERGTISIWGGINQRRRGYVHRNYYDYEYPSGGLWKPEIDFCGATSVINNPITVQLFQNPPVAVTLYTRHFNGAQGTGTGYKKNYNYDSRMYHTKPPCWPYFKKQGQRLPLEQGSWYLKRPPNALI